MSEGMYTFLGNLQIANIILIFLMLLAAVVALGFAIVAMFYAIKALRVYIANNGPAKEEKKKTLALPDKDAKETEDAVKEEKEAAEEDAAEKTEA